MGVRVAAPLEFSIQHTSSQLLRREYNIMGCTKFKVIIAGGGIAGLSLANMLQKTGIDFVVLEAYPELAPQVGASIGLLPHGLRILDQLGLYKPIRKLVAPLDHFHFRSLRGEIVAEHEGVADSFMAR